MHRGASTRGQRIFFSFLINSRMGFKAVKNERGNTTSQDVRTPAIEASTMNTSYKHHTGQFVHLCCEASILFSYVLGLTLVVMLGAY